MAPEMANGVIWAVAAGATAGVIVRPFRLPEAIWAVAGAALLIVLGLMPLKDAASAVGRGLDVYLFLIGMMLMSETARREGLFDWVAAAAVNHAKGSSKRLFLLVYLVGVVVTTFLSNDATAVVMTPAVFAAARKAEADPLPFLFICALIANAASFVLPISNPANSCSMAAICRRSGLGSRALRCPRSPPSSRPISPCDGSRAVGSRRPARPPCRSRGCRRAAGRRSAASW